MAEFTFDIKIPGALPYCVDTGVGIAAGDYLRVVIDGAKFPAAAGQEVDLLVNSVTAQQVWDPVASQLVSGYLYNVTGQDTEMPASMEDIDYCDITSWKCRSCCDLNADTFEAAILTGTGDPEGAVVASVGVLFLRTDGGASTTLYVKESGTGNTGWIAK